MIYFKLYFIYNWFSGLRSPRRPFWIDLQCWHQIVPFVLNKKLYNLVVFWKTIQSQMQLVEQEFKYLNFAQINKGKSVKFSIILAEHKIKLKINKQNRIANKENIRSVATSYWTQKPMQKTTAALHLLLFSPSKPCYGHVIRHFTTAVEPGSIVCAAIEEKAHVIRRPSSHTWTPHKVWIPRNYESCGIRIHVLLLFLRTFCK